MSSPAVRWAGPRTLLLELADLDDVVALHARLAHTPLPGQIEVLAAAETIMLAFDSRAHALAAPATLDEFGSSAAPAPEGREITLDVVYDGEDLDEVGRLTGLGADGVVAAHTGQVWTAAFGGFAPGFAYLHGEDESLAVPRRDTPRTAVPAGSVGLAGPFSAVYPARSPGGWQLIGRTTARMWDLGRERPALVRPGDIVHYRAVRDAVEVQPAESGTPATAPLTVPPPAPATQPAAGPAPAASGTALTVISPGLQSLIQDLGRPGLGDLGVPASGAADAASARQANRLVGNGPGDAVIETLLGGLQVRAVGALVLALAGSAESASISGPHGERTATARAPFALHDGETLTLDSPGTGLRSFLAVRGGLAVAPVLGSRSTDTLSGLGPAPLAAGVSLPIGPAGHGHIVGNPEPAATDTPGEGTLTLRVTPGPRADWFDEGALDALCGASWTAGTQSNRIGVRLEAGDGQAPLRRTRTGELASEGTATGSLQVPPSGLPVLFLADHPVTGGYPVIAVVVPEDLPAAAQAAPGTALRFRVVDPDTLEADTLDAAAPAPAPATTEGTRP
ncbi:carboxyltransferase domain-containing protein [Arthrobacter sp. JSM 101049]|uniref:5-oxoprolinase subunit B/C family protein n=1 Tax=Arthrobacter sp. JSM 101049 TaxID=929097 RepID=UPI0035627611